MNNILDLKQASGVILDAIKNSKSILVHFHPSPDPDSVGSALAMKFAVEKLGKKVTVIKGDSDFPEAFMHFPGTDSIVHKNFLEIDQKEYDLFLILDAAQTEMISRRGEITFAPHLKTVVIDHHSSNPGFAQINLVEKKMSSCAEVLYHLFKSWGLEINENIASNLFIGMYTDTGAFRYPGVTTATYEAVTDLSSKIKNIPELIGKVINSLTKENVLFFGEAIHNTEIINNFCAFSSVPYTYVSEKKIPANDMRSSEVSSYLNTCKDWHVSICAVEIEPNKTKFSLRSKDGIKYNVAELVKALGGGGHKAAAGLVLDMPLKEAKEKVVNHMKEMYNL